MPEAEYGITDAAQYYAAGVFCIIGISGRFLIRQEFGSQRTTALGTRNSIYIHFLMHDTTPYCSVSLMMSSLMLCQHATEMAASHHTTACPYLPHAVNLEDENGCFHRVGQCWECAICLKALCFRWARCMLAYLYLTIASRAVYAYLSHCSFVLLFFSLRWHPPIQQGLTNKKGVTNNWGKQHYSD